jgi:lipopolysaccharide export system permease protein
VVVGLIIIQEIYTKLNGLIERGATVLEIITSFSLTIPVFLPTIVPLVLLLSVLFSVSALHRRNEIIAMKAAGISLWKISQPLMLAAVLCAASILYLNASFIPWSVEQQEQLKRQIHDRGFAGYDPEVERKDRVIRNLGALNFRENRLWLMGSYYPFDRRGAEVTVYEMDDDGKEVYRIRAVSAQYLVAEKCWKFFNGRELYYNKKSEEPYRNRKFDELVRSDYLEDPDVMVFLRKKPQDLSLYELKQVLAVYEGYENPQMIPYKVRFYRILASPFSCLLVVGFGVPFAASGVRTNPMIGISKAFGMFIIYFVVSNIATILGGGGWISPLVSSMIPLIFIGIIAARVFQKAQ